MRTRIAVLTCGLALSGCSATEPPAPAGAPAPAVSPPPADADRAVEAARFEHALRDRLHLPALPSFALPEDVLTAAGSDRLARRLELEPGLYRGIAVLDARCSPDSDAPLPADGGAVNAGGGGAGHLDDGTRSVTVAGDGTGVYDAPGLHVVVLPGGAGVYEDDEVRLTVQSDGSGTYTDADRRLTVRADGSGSFADGESRLWVGPDGSGGYDDDRVDVSVQPDGRVDGRGDPELVAAAVRVVRDGLPRFAPVPAITRPRPAGTTCGAVIRLDANVLFDVGAADVRPDGARLVQRVAALLRELGSPPLAVNGHTDHLGSEEDNLELSRRRAGAVRDALVAAGVAESALTTRGLGEAQPLRPEVRPDGGDDPAARQLNRRVELILPD